MRSATSNSTSRFTLGTSTHVSRSAENTGSGVLAPRGPHSIRDGVGIRVVQAEPLRVGHHVIKSLPGSNPLPLPVFEQVLQANLPVTARLVERDDTGLQQTHQR